MGQCACRRQGKRVDQRFTTSFSWGLNTRPRNARIILNATAPFLDSRTPCPRCMNKSYKRWSRRGANLPLPGPPGGLQLCVRSTSGDLFELSSRPCPPLARASPQSLDNPGPPTRIGSGGATAHAAHSGGADHAPSGMTGRASSGPGANTRRAAASHPGAPASGASGSPTMPVADEGAGRRRHGQEQGGERRDAEVFQGMSQGQRQFGISRMQSPAACAQCRNADAAEHRLLAEAQSAPRT
jgi:hypothetical protein